MPMSIPWRHQHDPIRATRSSLRAAMRAALALTMLAAAASAGSAHEVYVSNEKDNTLSVIDTKSLTVVRTIKVGQRPRGITFSRD